MVPASVRTLGASRASTSDHEPGVHQRDRTRPGFHRGHRGLVLDGHRHPDVAQSHLHRVHRVHRHQRGHRGHLDGRGPLRRLARHGRERRGAGQRNDRASCRDLGVDLRRLSHRDVGLRRLTRGGVSHHLIHLDEAYPDWLRTGCYRDEDRHHQMILDGASHLGHRRVPFPGSRRTDYCRGGALIGRGEARAAGRDGHFQRASPWGCQQKAWFPSLPWEPVPRAWARAWLP